MQAVKTAMFEEMTPLAARIAETGSDMRAGNMLEFTRAALELLDETLAGCPESDQP